MNLEEGLMPTKDNYFTFVVPHLDKNPVDISTLTFQVRLFEGKEALSKPYKFTINLISEKAVQGAELLYKEAKLTIQQDQSSVTYHGIVTEFQQGQKTGNAINYQAVLSPKWNLLSLSKRSDIFVDIPLWTDDASKESIIKTVLKRANFTASDYRIALTGSYTPPSPPADSAASAPAKPEKSPYNRWSYVCQYEESDLDFLSRLMEREGIYYYFDQNPTDGEKKPLDQAQIVLTDHAISHRPRDLGLVFKPAYEPAVGPSSNAIQDLTVRDGMVPQKVILKNYNYERADLNILSVEATASKNGIGEVVSYGENFNTKEEGDQLAKIRAEGLLCKGRLFFGDSTAVPLMPGILVKLDHPDTAFNGEFLVKEVTHNGSQPLGWLTSTETAAANETYAYRNYFYFLPKTYAEKETVKDKETDQETITETIKDLQFRPERVTPKPKISGTMNAFIAGDVDIPLDDTGRYKVELPFTTGVLDSKGVMTMKKSAWVCMASPYAGAGSPTYGMHLPLHKGAEVILSFRDGDPDLPVISGAAFNSQHFNTVTDKNMYQHIVKTPGENEIVMDDTKDAASIHLKTHGGHEIVMDDTKDAQSIHLQTHRGNKIFMNDKEVTKSIHLKTPGGNEIVMDDTSGAQSIHLHSPFGEVGKGSWIYIGKGGEKGESSENKHEVINGQADTVVIGAENSVNVGSKMEAMIGTASEFTVAMKSLFELAGTLEFKYGAHLEFGNTTERIKKSDELLGTEKVSLQAGLHPGAAGVLSGTQQAVLAAVAATGALLAAFGGDMAASDNPHEDHAKASLWPIVSVATLAQLVGLVLLLKRVKMNLLSPASKLEMDNQGITLEKSLGGGKITIDADKVSVEQGTCALRVGTIVGDSKVGLMSGNNGFAASSTQVGISLGNVGVSLDPTGINVGQNAPLVRIA